MTTTEQSIPSGKFLKLEKEKVVEKAEEEKITNVQKKKQKKGKLFDWYFFGTEIALALTGIITLIIVTGNPRVFFDQQGSLYNYQYGDLSSTVLAGWALISIIPLINNYLFIFILENTNRLKAYIIRSITIGASIAIMITVGFNEDIYPDIIYSLAVFIAFYTLFGNFYLRTVLLFTEKTSKALLFYKSISSSPAELEWKKYNNISGYFAIISGIFMLQIFWFVYHLFIRPAKINKVKDQLIIESLNFSEEVNVSKIALELAISLEEVIFRLKRLVFKEQIKGEFTRYGFILREVRKPKWFSNKVAEKYEEFLATVKATEKEMHINRFFELAEMRKVRVSEFRRVLKVKDDFKSSDLKLILPPNAVKIKSNVFTYKSFYIFNYDVILLKRKQIKESLLYHFDEIFDLKEPAIEKEN